VKEGARCKVFTVVNIQVVFWVVMSCSVVVGYQHFVASCCLHLQGEVTVARKKGQLYRPGVQEEKGGFCQPMLLVVGGGELFNQSICQRYQGTTRQSRLPDPTNREEVGE
jgi:hypothetical protein